MSYVSHCTQFVKITQMDCNNSMLNRYLFSHNFLTVFLKALFWDLFCFFYTYMIYLHVMSKV